MISCVLEREPPLPQLLRETGRHPVYTRGIQTCVGTSRDSTHLHSPCFICTGPSFSRSPSPPPQLWGEVRMRAVCTLSDRIPSGFPSALPLWPQWSSCHSSSIPGIAPTSGPLHLLLPLSGMLFPSYLLGSVFCKNVTFSVKPFLITLFKRPHTPSSALHPLPLLHSSPTYPSPSDTCLSY